MAKICTDGLTPTQRGQLDKALDAFVRVDGVVMTVRQSIAPLSGRKKETDGMSRYNRVRFNRMGYREQEAYVARLRAKRRYCLAVPLAGYDGDAWREVPKIVYDAVVADDTEVAAPGDVWCTDDDIAHLFGDR